MHFYEIDAEMTNAKTDATMEEQMSYPINLRRMLEGFYYENESGIVFISAMSGMKLSMGAIARDTVWLGKSLPAFFEAVKLECRDITVEETTFKTIRKLLCLSSRQEYIHDSEEVLDQFGLGELAGLSYLSYIEYILPEPERKTALLKKAKNLLCAGRLLPELDRIYQPAAEKIYGHPVHYFVQSDSDYVCDSIYEILLAALYANGRLTNRRYSVASLNEDRCREKEITALYEVFTGGAIIIKLGDKYTDGMDPEARLLSAIFGSKDDDDKNTEIFWLDRVCRVALEFRDKVLTIFCLPRTSERVKAKMKEQLGIMTLVELTEDYMPIGIAKAFLRRIASDREIPMDKSLCESIEGELKTFSSSELLRVFDTWHSRRLKTVYYPQYASFSSSGQSAINSMYSGNAFDELRELIGLDEAKTIIKQAVDYFQAQKLFRDRGLYDNRPTMHMTFTGSPGTAKTTVAKLFARIMREKGLLSVGKLFEVGRSDLVGKYVGWTAQKVEGKFREAMGSVLFIDEAHSLIDDRECMYGDEAINTIVAEMENRREDLVVIFAGYTEKMEEFLRRNPGLRSRIAFHVPFADYTPGELMQILELIAAKQTMTLDENVKDKVLPIISTASREPDFGNGRFMRNLFERARMKQAGRLLKMDIDSVTADQVKQLIPDDFETPATTRMSKQRIGFL